MSAEVGSARSLAGDWDFRFGGQRAWRRLHVPGAWDAVDVSQEAPGPAWYRRRLVLPGDATGRRFWLCFGAVSYACTVIVDGRTVGRHTGAWDAFSVEITDAITTGREAELLLRVEKPASLRQGPDSAAVPGAFPMRETLAGFLPYVWGHAFGGIWQDVSLVTTGETVFGDVDVAGGADGRLAVIAEISAPCEVGLTILDPTGRVLSEHRVIGVDRVRFDTTIAEPRPWSLADPARYEARLRIAGGDERIVHFGLRTVGVDGTTILLNGHPIYPRLALSWGWYSDRLDPNPGPGRVRADLERLKRLGYNGVKLCLWFPPPYYFDLADELGMLLWVELPMWLPDPTPYFRRQTPIEYARLVRQARGHPSVVLYTLGCELGSQISADILGSLYASVKELAGDALVRDNSGSGEAYGGLLNEHADYYDYHFYSDLPFLRGLLDHFTPRWRPELPWLFGEFCDYDTFRDLRRVYAWWHERLTGLEPSRPAPTDHRSAGTAGGERPWWTSADAQRNPQGARWQFDLPQQESRLRANGFWERGAALEALSERQGLLHRKWTLELMRTYREVSGYVVTGEADTPISTAGMWDDTGRLKFDPEVFRRFNDDLVVLVAWDKRRAWVAGGDRAAPYDTFSYTAGGLVRPHLLVSHYGRDTAPAWITWSVAFPGEAPFATGERTTPLPMSPGSLREVMVAEFRAPEVAAPRMATLRAHVRIGAEVAGNSWPLWFFPARGRDWSAQIALADPAGRLGDLPLIAPRIHGDLTRASVVIATAWSPAVASFVEGGGAAVLVQADSESPGPVPTVAMPFWREAVKLIEPHPAWADFPHGGAPGLQFLGCATEQALSTSGLDVAPILRRLDARTMAVHDYAAEMAMGAGRLIATTLRFEGDHGEQPLGVSRNTAAAYLLWCFAHALVPDADIH